MNQEEGWLQARRERARRRQETSEDREIRLQRRREHDRERSEQETPVHHETRLRARWECTQNRRQKS